MSDEDADLPRVETEFDIDVVYRCPFCTTEHKTCALVSEDKMQCKSCKKEWINEVDVSR